MPVSLVKKIYRRYVFRGIRAERLGDKEEIVRFLTDIFIFRPISRENGDYKEKPVKGFDIKIVIIKMLFLIRGININRELF